MLVAMWTVSMPSWAAHNFDTLKVDKNAEWTSTKDWVTQNISPDQVVAVPPSMWQDLRDAGWRNQWTVVSAEKVDLDPGFAKAHGDTGWRALDYVILNPTVKANMGYLGLTQLSSAVAHGVPVATLGGTQILRIDPSRPAVKASP
jgi:hypothetical protein